MTESYHQVDGYQVTERGYLYPDSLDTWAEAIVVGEKEEADVVVFANGRDILRLFVQPCSVDDRSKPSTPRFVVQHAVFDTSRPWNAKRLRGIIHRLRFRTLYEGEDARFVARVVRGSEQLRPLVVEDDENEVVENATYPRVLSDMSVAKLEVSDEGDVAQILFLAPSGRVLELWAQPACVEARMDNDVGVIFPDQMDLDRWPRFILNEYTGPVHVRRADEDSFEEWYDSDDFSNEDWNRIFSGESPSGLIDAFENVAMGGLDWRPR
jgi:hypothetical protein